jgi:hypothetical protein
MAIDTQSARVLLAARKAGVDFTRTLTFGRQSYFPKRRPLHAAVISSGLPLDADAIAALPKGYAEPFLTALGAQSVDSMDASTYEQATVVHDLNLPVPAPLHGRYSLVFDGGTTEHVYQFPQAIDNAIRLLAPGGHYISITTGNNLPGHGFYQISPELFFRVFCAANGFKTRAVLLIEMKTGGGIYRVTDPAELHARVEYVSRGPFLVAVITQKISAVAGLSLAPQQSDYQAAWAAGRGQSQSRVQRELRRLASQVRAFLGRNLFFAWQNRGIARLSDRELYSL